MNKEKILRAYNSYICTIDLGLVLDTVVISNHPSVMQRMTAYSRESILTWLAGSNSSCPVTRDKLDVDQLELSSIQMEVTMFLLSAEKHLDLLDSEEKSQKEDIQKTLQKLRDANPTLVETASSNLEKLQKDDRVDLSLDAIESLIDFGVPGDYKKQSAYAHDRQATQPDNTPKGVAVPSEQNSPLKPKKTEPLPEAPTQQSSNKWAIIRGLKFVGNIILSAFVALKNGITAFFAVITAPFRRNNAQVPPTIMPDTTPKVERESSNPRPTQSTTSTLNTKLPARQEPPIRERNTRGYNSATGLFGSNPSVGSTVLSQKHLKSKNKYSPSELRQPGH